MAANASSHFSPLAEPNYRCSPSGGRRHRFLNMLWDQTQQLPKELFKKVEDTYEQHFPLEVRLQLASWIEEKFNPSLQYNSEDANDQQAAVAVANELIVQLDQRIADMPNDPEKFLMKGKLGEIAEKLKVSRSCEVTLRSRLRLS